MSSSSLELQFLTHLESVALILVCQAVPTTRLFKKQVRHRGRPFYKSWHSLTLGELQNSYTFPGRLVLASVT